MIRVSMIISRLMLLPRNQMLGDRLLARRNDIGHTADNVQFGHVASDATARNLVAAGAIPVNGPPRTVAGKTGDIAVEMKGR